MSRHRRTKVESPHPGTTRQPRERAAPSIAAPMPVKEPMTGGEAEGSEGSKGAGCDGESPLRQAKRALP